MTDGRRGSIGLGGLTPLLDTIFILLFALLALADVRTSEHEELVRVALPRVEPGHRAAPGDEPRVVVEIRADSSVVVQPDDVRAPTPEALDRVLDALLAGKLPEEVVVEIQADRDARHGVAVEILQHLRNRGFQRVDLVAAGREGGAAAAWGDGR